MPTTYPVRVGLCGEYQVGKSLLINCLLKEDVALVGDGLATTPFPVVYQWAEQRGAELVLPGGAIHRKFTIKCFLKYVGKQHRKPNDEGRKFLRQFIEARIGLPCPQLHRITLVDTPGVNAVSPHGFEGDSDQAKADRAIASLDCAVMVRKNGPALTSKTEEWALLSKLVEEGIPFVVVMNCFSDPEPSPGNKINQDLIRENKNLFKAHYPTSLLALWNPPSDGWHGVETGKVDSLSKQGILPVNANWHRIADMHEGPVRQKKLKRIANEAGFDGEIPSLEEVRRLSRVPELARFVFPDPLRSVGLNAYCLGTLHRAAAQWGLEAMEQIHNREKSVH